MLLATKVMMGHNNRGDRRQREDGCRCAAIIAKIGGPAIVHREWGFHRGRRHHQDARQQPTNGREREGSGLFRREENADNGGVVVMKRAACETTFNQATRRLLQPIVPLTPPSPVPSRGRCHRNCFGSCCSRPCRSTDYRQKRPHHPLLSSSGGRRDG